MGGGRQPLPASEDRFLRAELTGYADYAERVRYRLLPGIWQEGAMSVAAGLPPVSRYQLAGPEFHEEVLPGDDLDATLGHAPAQIARYQDATPEAVLVTDRPQPAKVVRLGAGGSLDFDRDLVISQNEVHLQL